MHKVSERQRLAGILAGEQGTSSTFHRDGMAISILKKTQLFLRKNMELLIANYIFFLQNNYVFSSRSNQ